MALIQSKAATAAAASVVGTFTNKVQAGNLLLAVGWGNANAAMTIAESGWTAQGSDNTTGTTRRQNVWYKQADGTETTATIGCTGASTTKVHMYEYAGFAAVLDGSPGLSSSAGVGVVTLATAAITTSFPDSLVFMSVATFGAAISASSWSPTAVNAQLQTRVGSEEYDYYPGAPLTAWTDTMSWTTSAQAETVVVAFKRHHRENFLAFMGS